MELHNTHIVELKDEDVIDTSLLSLRSLTTQKGVSRSKVLYNKKKLVFQFSSAYEIKRGDKYTQFKLYLTPTEERNLDIIEKKIKKMMVSKLKHHQVIDSFNEANEYFQSSILSDHESSVFVCKVESNLGDLSMAGQSYRIGPVDIKFKAGKSMHLGYNTYDDKDTIVDDETLVHPLEVSDGKQDSGMDRGDTENTERKRRMKENENENEDAYRGEAQEVIHCSKGEESATDIVHDHDHDEDENENENEDEKGDANEIRNEGHGCTIRADDRNLKNCESENGNGNENENDSLDISVDYTECIRSAQNALVELKSKETDIKRALAKYVHFAGSYLPYTKTKNGERQILSKKHREKYLNYKAELLFLL